MPPGEAGECQAQAKTVLLARCVAKASATRFVFLCQVGPAGFVRGIEFFTTGPSLYWKRRVLYYRAESVLEVASSLLQGRVCTGSGKFHHSAESALGMASSLLQG